MKFERDHSHGSIWEWADISVDDVARLEKWVAAKKLTVRFEGSKYLHDQVIPDEMKEQMREVIAVWKGMGGGRQ